MTVFWSHLPSSGAFVRGEGVEPLDRTLGSLIATSRMPSHLSCALKAPVPSSLVS